MECFQTWPIFAVPKKFVQIGWALEKLTRTMQVEQNFDGELEKPCVTLHLVVSVVNGDRNERRAKTSKRYHCARG